MKGTRPNSISTTSKANGSNRRSVFVKSALVAAALATLTFAVSAGQQTNNFNANSTKGAKMNSVKFSNGPISMAGNLYLPNGFDATKKYSAVVVVHPGGGVKEQTAGLYAKKLSEEGFVAIAYDASHQGESGGMPRLLESPQARVEDIRSAVDYLTTLAYVDATSIGALGICAGSGYTIKAGTLDPRIKSLVTVSAVDIGASARKGWYGKGPVADQVATLAAVAAERTAIAKGAAPTFVQYLPEVNADTPRDLREAYDYYRLPTRQLHPNSPNQMLLISLDKMIAFTGFDQIDKLLTQPLLVIAGKEAGSLWHSQELHAKAASKDKELFTIDGAAHMDLYEGKHVDQAMTKISPFFSRTL